MPKVKISEYSATANSNTDVASINIDEGCAPSGINNAIRAVMGHLKDFQQGTYGDPFNGPVNGTVGATTPSTGAFTTLTTTGTINLITVGRGAGAVATNTAVGASALAANTSGAGNIAIGDRALNTNTTGSSNVGIGQVSLFASTGDFNTAIGAASLRFNTTASNNTAVGYQALYANTTGLNTAFGAQALQNTTTGTQNVSVGSGVSGSFGAPLYNTTTGSYNVAMGYGALQANTTAEGNTAVGYQAGYTNTTGTYNTYFGWHAGYVATGTGNIYLGTSAGYAMTTGSKNTILGAYGGNQGGLDIRTASNYIVLSDGDGNARIIVGSDGYVRTGLGAGSPYNQTTSNAANMYVFSDGGLYRSTSSLKYKTDVKDAIHGLSDLLKLRPVTYKGINDGDTVFGGLIAEEVDAVGLTEFVQYADDGTPDALAYGNMVSLCVKAIQELKAEVDSLKAQINGASA